MKEALRKITKLTTLDQVQTKLCRVKYFGFYSPLNKVLRNITVLQDFFDRHVGYVKTSVNGQKQSHEWNIPLQI